MSDFKLAKKVKIVRMSNEYSIGMEFHEGLNKNESRLFLYLGTVNNMDMYASLLSIKDKDYIDNKIRKSNYFTEYLSNEKKETLGKINFNGIIPIPKKNIKRVDFNSNYFKKNSAKRSRLFSEIRYIKKNLEKITDKFNVLYHEKINENAYPHKRYLKNTNDFDALIEKSLELTNTKRLEKLQNTMISKIEDIRFDLETLIINNCETKRENPEVLLDNIQTEIEEQVNSKFDPIHLNEFIKELELKLQDEEALEETLINKGRSR